MSWALDGWLPMAGAVGGVVAAALTTVGGWLFKRIIAQHDAEMAALKNGLAEVKQAMASEYVKQDVYEQNRKEMREGIITLHEKIETTSGDLHRKIEQGQRDAEQRHSQLVSILLQKDR